MFVFGGTQPEGVDGHAFEMYDPDAKVWSAFASQVAPRITSAVSFKGKNLRLWYFSRCKWARKCTGATSL